MSQEERKLKSVKTEFRSATVLLAAFLLLGFGFDRYARADCPESCITAYHVFNYCTTASQLDTVINYQYSPARASFDVPNRTLYAQCGGLTGVAPTTVVEDEFTVLGLPSGTPVLLTARLATTTSGFCVFLGAIFQARLTKIDGSSIELDWTDSDPVQSPLLSLPIEVVADEPFRMRYAVTSGSECESWIEGTFYFDGLPAGASLISCKGFREEAVSVRSSTWSYLKGLYRGGR